MCSLTEEGGRGEGGERREGRGGGVMVVATSQSIPNYGHLYLDVELCC